MRNKLYRSRTDRVLAGVCAGLATHFRVDPVLIRVLFIAAAIGGGFGVLAYLIFWIVTPEAPYPGFENPVENPGYQADATPSPNPTPESMSNNNAKQGSIIAGTVLILLGAMFLADELLPDFDFGKFWPVILIVIGAAMLFGVKSSKKEEDAR